MRVGDRHSFRERHENVAIACEDDAITFVLQDLSQPLRNVEGFIFFANPLAGNAAPIESSVARVNHDRLA